MIFLRSIFITIMAYSVFVNGMTEITPWDTLPKEVWRLCITELLYKYPSKARNLLYTSRLFKEIVEDPYFIKAVIDKQREYPHHYYIATAMQTVASRCYIQHNETLFKESDITSYFSCLKIDPWADINYISSTGFNKLHYYCRNPGIVDPSAPSWVTQLLAEGADQNQGTKHPAPLEEEWPFYLVFNMLTKGFGPDTPHMERNLNQEKFVFPILSALLNSHTMGTALTEGIQNISSGMLVVYQDIFFTKFIIDHGIHLRDDQYPLHNYLDRSKKHAKPKIVEFLLELGCDPTCYNPYKKTTTQIVEDEIHGGEKDKILALLNHNKKS